MKWGVVRFPGSLDDGDAMYALASVMGENARILWHKETTLDGVELVTGHGPNQRLSRHVTVPVLSAEDRKDSR